MTNVLYRRIADFDTDFWAANHWIEQSQSVSASNDKSFVTPSGGDSHNVIMSGDPKPDSAEVAEDCCSPNDLTSCSGYLADNPATPVASDDFSGVLEWNLGSMANLAGRTRTTSYSVDEDMRK